MKTEFETALETVLDDPVFKAKTKFDAHVMMNQPQWMSYIKNNGEVDIDRMNRDLDLFAKETRRLLDNYEREIQIANSGD